MSIKKDGIMVILSSPSGAGKTTLVKLLSEQKKFQISISHTTRKPRINEIDGKDYFFVNHEYFQRSIKNHEFLEYAEVFKNFYGTKKDPVIKFLKDLERGIVNFLEWLQSLAKLADAGIYAVTFTANGKAGLAKKLDELKTADGAPPKHLKYSFAVLLLGATSDFNAFLNFLNTL